MCSWQSPALAKEPALCTALWPRELSSSVRLGAGSCAQTLHYAQPKRCQTWELWGGSRRPRWKGLQNYLNDSSCLVWVFPGNLLRAAQVAGIRLQDDVVGGGGGGGRWAEDRTHPGWFNRKRMLTGRVWVAQAPAGLACSQPHEVGLSEELLLPSFLSCLCSSFTFLFLPAGLLCCTSPRWHVAVLTFHTPRP